MCVLLGYYVDDLVLWLCPLFAQDCDECINKDPQFSKQLTQQWYDYVLILWSLVKGYLRKGQALIGMKEYTRAQQAYQKVLDIDPNNGVCFIVKML